MATERLYTRERSMSLLREMRVVFSILMCFASCTIIVLAALQNHCPRARLHGAVGAICCCVESLSAQLCLVFPPTSRRCDPWMTWVWLVCSLCVVPFAIPSFRASESCAVGATDTAAGCACALGLCLAAWEATGHPDSETYFMRGAYEMCRRPKAVAAVLWSCGFAALVTPDLRTIALCLPFASTATAVVTSPYWERALRRRHGVKLVARRHFWCDC